ncbi:MAG: peptidyl-prolyl cis-trans isomerase [Deltaproteobacteria bacterium]|nr:peptidyl-prolyl cis-trans isomerase [Deltaproteobacteria bacterium]
MVRRLLREPLVHFVVLGAALFALHRAVAPPGATSAIVVTTALQRGFQQEHLRRHGRLPTPEEQRALVDRYVDTEVMLREALALGLDRGDIIVRRRLVQKMEFLNQDREPLPPPTDADLAAFLARHAERYQLAARMTVAHVFVSTRLHPEDTEAVADELRARLAAGDDAAGLGDPFLRGREFRAATEGELAGVFGPDLARRLQSAPVGEWVGPYRSSFGVHLVRIATREGGRPATVDEVRRELVRDWEEERRSEAARAALGALRARYDVRIEEPPTPGRPAS